MVVPYYEEHPLAGSGMILWGDLQVLFESHEGGTGAGVWADQQHGLSGVGGSPINGGQYSWKAFLSALPFGFSKKLTLLCSSRYLSAAIDLMITKNVVEC
ncbi:hypothetical protein Tco_0301465 [Tanacetum coccineum]